MSPKLRIDTQDPRPIWRQIEEGITHWVATGALAAGAAVPSVRDMARELRVNPALAGHVDGGEQHVSGLVEGLLVRPGLAQLLQLSLDRVVGHLLEVEAGRRRAALDLTGV